MIDVKQYNFREIIIKWGYEKSNGQNGFWGEKEVDSSITALN